MNIKWQETISKTPLFSGVLEEELPYVISCLKTKTLEYKKGEYVAIAGNKFEGVGLVLDGEVAITKENAIGSRAILAIFKKGDMFGEIMAFADGNTWPATVVSQSESTIMFIRPEKILGICDKACPSHKLLISNMLKIIAKKALLLNKKIEYLTIKSMKGKLSKYLLEQYKKTGNLTFNLPLNREELADFLNVSRPSMSRELCKMRDEGMLDFYKDSIRILDLSAVKSLLE